MYSIAILADIGGVIRYDIAHICVEGSHSGLKVNSFAFNLILRLVEEIAHIYEAIGGLGTRTLCYTPYEIKEGSHSGLVRCLGKAVLGKPDQEFESPTLRSEQSEWGRVSKQTALPAWRFEKQSYAFRQASSRRKFLASLRA